MQQIVCKDSEILQSRLHADLMVYADSVARLILATEDAFKKDYERAKRAKRAFKLAKKQLDQHITKHHCEPPHPR